MHDAFRLYLRLVAASIRGQLRYPVSFVLQVVGMVMVTGIEIVGIWALFDRFHSVGGWSLPEVGLLYGLVGVSLSITDTLARGFDTFGGLVQSGGFDLLLVRPRSTALQVAARELQLRRLGRMLQGGLVLAWALGKLAVAWTPLALATLAGAVAGGVLLFYGILICQATMCFWTVESLEMFNILSYGGAETSQYPVVVYGPWIRRMFTYVVPVAAVTYFPAVAVLGRVDPLGTGRVFQRCAPLLGVLFLMVSLLAWRVGVRHYRSTGS